MRNRGSAVILKDCKVALIKREKDGMIYYVFPGGGIEQDESPEEATIREAAEELGVSISIKKLLTEVEFNGTQYFFISEITNGVFGTGKGEEFTDIKRNRGTYEPMWVEIHKLNEIDVRPTEVSHLLMSLYT